MSVDILLRGRSWRIDGKEAVEELTDAVDEGVDGARWFLSEERLELGEGHLDRVHVWAVGRQVEDLRASRGDGLADAGDLVGGQVVEHDDIAALKGRGERLADVDAEGVAIHGSVEHPGRGEPRQAQAGDEGHGLPVTEGHAVAAALADRRPAIEARHLGVDTGLVEEDQAMRIDEGLSRLPQLAAGGDVGPVLLGRAQGFF